MESGRPFEENTGETPSCKNLLVGNKPCTYSAICDALRSSSAAENLWRNLEEVARSLQYSEDRVVHMTSSLLTGFKTHYSILYDILVHWRAKATNDATLHALLDLLDSKGLNECAVSLRHKFCSCSQIENKVRALNAQISFQGSLTKLKHILHGLEESSVHKIMDMYSQVSNYQHLIKNTVPEKVKYYVSRRLTSRNHLNSSVFKAKCSDIFIINQIQMHELSILANGQGTDLSGNQVKKLTARFILLEHKSDYFKICTLSMGQPVHLITHEKGNFIWIRTHGNLSTLKDFIDSDQTEWNESQFTSTCLKSTVPICLADTPGMGKTMLLISIGRQILESQPHRLVIFIVLRDVVPKVYKKRCESDVRALIKMFAKQASDFEFGRELVTELFNCKTQVVELMCDGLDEVLLNQLTVAKAMLKTISRLPSVRLYVSTRPHLRDELENTVGALGYNLLQFGRDEQVNFLIKYWVNESGAMLNKKLIEFSEQCLDKLMRNMNDFERELAGIPLQCSLLAIVYQDSAVKYADIEGRLANFDSGVQINITSIFEMYTELMKIRFKRLRNLENKKIWENISFLRQLSLQKRESVFRKEHMRAALELLFPSEANLFSNLKNDYVETYHLCALGIMEKIDSGDGTPRFVHRTFAEYYIGLLVVETLVNPKFLSEIPKKMIYECVKFCIFTVLGTFIENVESPLNRAIWGDVDPIQYSGFHYPVICYFVNSHLKNYSFEKMQLEEFIFYVLNKDEKVYDILEAAAQHDFPVIFKYLTGFFSFEYPVKYMSEKFIERYNYSKIQVPQRDASTLSNILFVASKKAGLDLVKLANGLCGTKIRSVLSKSPDFLVTPLHVAVERGHYHITEYFLSTFEKLKNLSYIMHCCVARSANENESVIFHKSQIVVLLAKKCKHWLDEALPPDGTTPLLQQTVHKSLVASLLHSGANVNTRNKNGHTALLQILGQGNSFSVDLIKLMVKKGMKLKSLEASEALRSLICNTSLMTGELEPVDFVNVSDYLVQEGAVLATEAGVRPWEHEVTKTNIEIISPLTECSEALYLELKNRGVETRETVSKKACRDFLLETKFQE